MTSLRPLAIGAAALAIVATAYVTGRQNALAQTQAEMNHSSYLDFQKKDKELNVVYAQLIKKYPKGPDTAITHKKIVTAERAWLTYRDAEGDMEASIGGEGGTIYPTIFNLTLEEVTTERIKTLKQLIHQNDNL